MSFRALKSAVNFGKGKATKERERMEQAQEIANKIIERNIDSRFIELLAIPDEIRKAGIAYTVELDLAIVRLIRKHRAG